MNVITNTEAWNATRNLVMAFADLEKAMTKHATVTAATNTSKKAKSATSRSRKKVVTKPATKTAIQ